MLATLSRRLSWLAALRLWWWGRRAARRPDGPIAGIPRRYPIPAHRARYYARAADEVLYA